PLLLSIACNHMRILPKEAFNAVTINGAHAMELGVTHGSIGIGKAANLIITHPIPSLEYMVYAFGTSHVDQVILGNDIF
ncbi:MAG: amidohydrolase family protein, partial [Saprospiraceae bacterium]